MSHFDHSLTRIDAQGKVTGETRYPGDIDYADQVYMKILFAQRAHAKILAIDTEAAESLPGVLAVLTAKDVPVNEYGLIMPDQPVLCGPGSVKPFAERVRFVGDQVAVVVAESEKIAAEARDLIFVEYEDLAVVTDPLEARKPDSERVHPEKDSNTLLAYKIRKGDIEAGFREADVIIEGEYRTPVQEHAYLQPEAGVAYLDEAGRITIAAAGQWAHEDREQIAHALALPEDQVRVIYPAIGGAFGGREDLSIQVVLGLAVLRLHEKGIERPVKIVWTREESMIGHHKRHAYVIRSKWGAKKTGELVAAQVEVIEDAGAYAYTSTKVLGNATLMCTGPYVIPHVKVDSCAVYTNNVPGGAFRGFGGPQAAFSAEQQINKLAEALGIDPVEIRKINAIKDGSLLSVNTPLPKGVSMTEVIEACAQAQTELTSPPDSPDYLKYGIGFAAGFKNIGFSFGFPEECWATLELRGDATIEEAILYHAGADVGQGAHTVFTQNGCRSPQLTNQ